MKKGAISLLSVLVVTLLFLGVEANAESGKYKAFYGWHAVGDMQEMDDGSKKFTGELIGTSFNKAGSGFAHLMSTVCPITNEISADGTMNASGTCTMTDQAGDTIELKWSCKGKPKCEGTFTFTGGTGKYEGISGENDFFAAFVTDTEGYSDWDGQYKY